MAIFEIWTTEKNAATEYVLHGYGEIEKYNDPDDGKLKAEEGNDTIHRFPDGSYVLVGSTGNQYGDAYKLTEKPYKFTRYSGEGAFELKYNGEDVTSEVAGNKLRPDEGLSGLVNRDALHEIIDSRIAEAGGTGNSDREPVNHYYGGGDGYPDAVTEDDADYVVSSHSSLRSTLATADPGEVVFVDPDTVCYSPQKSERYVVPDGVTLASDRGVNGSDGALLHTDVPYSYGAEGLVSVEGDDARVTGLRIRGPHPDPDDGWVDHSYDYEQGGVNARQNDAKRLEVDNCEIWGFAHLVVAGENSHVHHNYLHDANMRGLGYCASTGSTEGTVFEYNYCRHWRHVVAASGHGGYEARFNLIDGPCISHAFDQHSPGGTYSSIHHNTVRVTEPVTGDPYAPLAAFRGSEVQDANVFKNWCYNPLPPRDEPAGWTDEFIIHPYADGTGWEGIEWWDNHLDESEPASDIGAPRPYPT